MSEYQKNTMPAAPVQHKLPAEEQEAEIDLMEVLFRLLGGWKLIVILAMAGALISGLYTHYMVTPMYEATAYIYVVNRNDSVINMADLQIGSALTSDYLRAFDMWEVQARVIDNLDLSYTYSRLRRNLTVKNPSNTRIISITYSSSDPNAAMNIANEYANVGSEYIAEKMSTTKPNVLSEALRPNNPVSPNLSRNVMLGFAVGAVLACAIIVIQMMADDKYKSAEDIRRFTGLTTLAVVPIEESMEAEREKVDRSNKKTTRQRRSK